MHLDWIHMTRFIHCSVKIMVRCYGVVMTTGTQVDTNLYGVHPFHMEISDGGAAHGYAALTYYDMQNIHDEFQCTDIQDQARLTGVDEHRWCY